MAGDRGAGAVVEQVREVVSIPCRGIHQGNTGPRRCRQDNPEVGAVRMPKGDTDVDVRDKKIGADRESPRHDIAGAAGQVIDRATCRIGILIGHLREGSIWQAQPKQAEEQPAKDTPRRVQTVKTQRGAIFAHCKFLAQSWLGKAVEGPKETS